MTCNDITNVQMISPKVQNPRRNSYAGSGCRHYTMHCLTLNSNCQQPISHTQCQGPTHMYNGGTQDTGIYCACAYECVCNRESSSLSTKVFRSIAVSDVTSMSIVKQCYVLDSILGTQCTNEVLNNPGLPLRDLKRRVLEADHLKITEKSGNHPSLTYVLP